MDDGAGCSRPGAGGRRPRKAAVVKENHWLDSLGISALAVSLEFLAEKTGNARAGVLGKALDSATGTLLENGKSPSRKVGELDNRGSHFYLALYWAQALAAQTDDAELAAAFTPLAQRLAADEEKIVGELAGVQGEAGRPGRLLLRGPGPRRRGHGPADLQRCPGQPLSNESRLDDCALVQACWTNGPLPNPGGQPRRSENGLRRAVA